MGVAVAEPLWHGVRGWRYFRRHPRYREAWRAGAGEAAFESAPFPLRVQSDADLAAARFGLLAWEDPFAADGPASPFWAEAPEVLAVLAPEGLVGELEPLAFAMARDAATLSGLRLLDGALLLKLEWAGAAAQMRLSGARTLDPARDRMLLCRAFELPLLARMTGMEALRAQAGVGRGKSRAG